MPVWWELPKKTDTDFEKKLFNWLFSLVHVPSTNTEKVVFMFYSAARWFDELTFEMFIAAEHS